MGENKLKLSKSVADCFAHSLDVVTQHHYTIERLTKDLKRFEAELSRQLEKNDKVIEKPIRHLITFAREFLSLCRQDGAAPWVPYCLAAVDYLVSTDDAEPDFEDYDGFGDDRQVFEAVIEEFSLTIKPEAA